LSPPWGTDDSDYSDQQYYLNTINIFNAWEIETGSSDITVAIVDSGIDTDHEEFVGRISELSYNVITDEIGISAVEDDLGHGTNVAGIIAANRSNNLGVLGITDNIKLLIIKTNEIGNETYYNSDVAKGIIYAVDNGADIINLSLGSTSPDSAIEAAINYAYDNQVFVVAASGNDGEENNYYPAAYANTISVGSIDEDLNLSAFSNYGTFIDLVAPGSEIVTTNLNNGYAMVSGTSFSAPQVSAVLSLLLSQREISYEKVFTILFNTTNDLGDDGKDNYYGYGLVDAYKQLTEDFVMVSFDSNGGTQYESIWINASLNYEVPFTPELVNYTFVGWYLDQALTIPYTSEYIFKSNTVLYAKYEVIYYTVNLYSESNIIETIEIASGDNIDVLPTLDKENYFFEGWYYEVDFQTKYTDQIINENVTLYAKFVKAEIKVTFLDATDNIFSETYVEIGGDVTPPENPIKTETELFRYEFDSWDTNLENITEETIFRPVFNEVFISSNVSLNAGIDTVYINQDWIDSNITLSSDLLTYTKTGNVDASNPGQNIILYEIFYNSEKVYEIRRVVNVIENKTNIKISIDSSITTFILGSDFNVPKANTNLGDVEVFSNIDYDLPGKYFITYRVDYGGITEEKTIYVYILESNSIPLNEIDWYINKGDDDE
ncbi:MAG: S8 family serine peptidase, partial [Candidatus Izimaplasma sp.]|nr:S8 family serine peptidase [Candidatus Izimaplasma bacterium]